MRPLLAIVVEYFNLKKVSIGFVGGGGHTKRLISILKDFKFCSIRAVYKPTKPAKSIDSKLSTTDKSVLLGCDVIIISSPNSTHYQYLDWLAKNFHGFIFCEKPPINNLKEMSVFKLLNSKKTFFGFNLRYSQFAHWSKETLSNEQLGKPINFSVSVGYGFGFKESYLTSWKSGFNQSPSGIIATLGIHYIDLARTILGEISDLAIQHEKFSRNGSVPDSASINILHKNGATSSILVSYATPCLDSMRLIGTNGYIELSENTLKLRSPRDSFDSDGLFTSPPIIRERIFAKEQFYIESLRSEVEFFLDVVTNNGDFPEELFAQSKEVNRLMLENYLI